VSPCPANDPVKSHFADQSVQLPTDGLEPGRIERRAEASSPVEEQVVWELQSGQRSEIILSAVGEVSGFDDHDAAGSE
jgi:hypothetical protein